MQVHETNICFSAALFDAFAPLSFERRVKFLATVHGAIAFKLRCFLQSRICPPVYTVLIL